MNSGVVGDTEGVQLQSTVTVRSNIRTDRNQENTINGPGTSVVSNTGGSEVTVLSF